MNGQQAAAVMAIARAVVATVRESEPMGAPAGPMYAAMMAQGCTLHQYQQLMESFVRLHLLTQDGDLYHIGSDAARIG